MDPGFKEIKTRQVNFLAAKRHNIKNTTKPRGRHKSVYNVHVRFEPFYGRNVGITEPPVFPALVNGLVINPGHFTFSLMPVRFDKILVREFAHTQVNPIVGKVFGFFLYRHPVKTVVDVGSFAGLFFVLVIVDPDNDIMAVYIIRAVIEYPRTRSDYGNPFILKSPLNVVIGNE